MTPAGFRAFIAKYGRAMVLKRRVGTTSAFTECTVNGAGQQYSPDQLVGGITQGDRRIRIAQSDIDAASWPGPPRKGDFLDGAAVQGVEPLYWGDDLVGFQVWVRG